VSVPTPRTSTRGSLAERAEFDLALDRAAGTRPITGNAITHHPDSAAALEEMLRRIAAAERWVHLENYIIRHDHTGRRFATALIERAPGLRVIGRAGAGVDTIDHCTLIDEEGIRLAKERGTFIVPTLLALDFIMEEGAKEGIPEYGLRKAKELAPLRDDALRAAFAAGVKVAFGTDTAVFPHGRGGREFGLMVKLGMSPLEALRSATLVAAEAAGMEKDIGAIEVGKYADLVAVTGNPLENISVMEQVKFVMKGGKVYKNDF